MGLNEDLGDRENVGNASLAAARAREAKAASKPIIPESLTDARLHQLAFDPAICNTTPETISVFRETILLRAAEAERARMRDAWDSNMDYFQKKLDACNYTIQDLTRKVNQVDNVLAAQHLSAGGGDYRQAMQNMIEMLEAKVNFLQPSMEECQEISGAQAANIEQLRIALRSAATILAQCSDDFIGTSSRDAFEEGIEAIRAILKTPSTPTPVAGLSDSPLDLEPYVVEVDTEGCNNCHAGTYWRVVFTPEEVALSTSYGDQEEAYDMAHELNAAYSKGFAAGNLGAPDTNVGTFQDIAQRISDHPRNADIFDLQVAARVALGEKP